MTSINNPLYYYPKAESTQFTEVSTGRIAPERFVRGEPKYWQKGGLIPQPEKRILVLCDWSLCGHTYTQVQETIEFLQDLLNQNFTLYAWQGDDAILLTRDNLIELYAIDFRRALIATDRSELNQVMLSKNVELDSIGLLDYFNHKQIRFAAQREICTHDIPQIEGGFNDEVDFFENICKSIQNISDPTKITNSKLNFFFMDDLKQFFPQLPVEIELKCAVIHESTQLEDLLNYDLKNLESLTVSYIVDERHIKQIFEQAPRLKHLELLRGCEVLERISFEWLRENLQVFSQLRRLIVNSARVSLPLFAEILGRAEQLEDLRLVACHFDSHTDGWLQAHPRALLKLKVFHLLGRWSSFDIRLFEEIVGRAAYQLQSLNLSGTRLEQPLSAEWVQKYPRALFNLVELDVSQVEFHEGIFEWLLKQAVNLRGLKALWPSQNLWAKLPKDFLQKNRYSLSNLRDLFTTDFSSVAMLEGVLERAEKLQYLDLSHYEQLCYHLDVSWLSLSRKALSQLKEFRAANSSIDAHQLNMLIDRAPNLLRLDLSNCHLGHYEDRHAFYSSALSRLKHLNLNNTTIDTLLLTQMVGQAPQLTQLNLNQTMVKDGMDERNSYRQMLEKLKT